MKRWSNGVMEKTEYSSAPSVPETDTLTLLNLTGY